MTSEEIITKVLTILNRVLVFNCIDPINNLEDFKSINSNLIETQKVALHLYDLGFPHSYKYQLDKNCMLNTLNNILQDIGYTMISRKIFKVEWSATYYEECYTIVKTENKDNIPYAQEEQNFINLEQHGPKYFYSQGMKEKQSNYEQYKKCIII